MFVKTYNQNGKEVEQTRLPSEIFNLKLNPDLVHQVVVSQMANRRRVIAHAKDRGEVRGGGKKPWRQKGTGRARHGSIRSPLWRGGGVTFGPTKERNYKKIIPKKMKRRALFMVLSSKAKDNELIIMDELKMEKVKTKEFAKILNTILGAKRSSILIALSREDENIQKAAENIPKTKIMRVCDLNALDLLNYKYLLITKEAIKLLQNIYLKK
ncbi:MAG: 50S ribosomal protein L4 [Parcubacteria group bacterium CG11_big_fil_rev_8_21_14_0_20_39_14]|nr:MAG: 50S ribosomal protein L4 [Parcubacteria group bacterium CG11_big_fil_rev_8_21_14_0_20_39_14]PIS35709.1 MAG: 50S ribosomal protein L4 [Parcubacteria group bacterium CG08_land_8_20_14_0_20_38_56]